MIVLVNFPIIIMHIMTTCEFFFACLCTLLEALWKFHANMASIQSTNGRSLNGF
jgi:hypothetical protein